MNRPLPGSATIEGREFLYLQHADAGGFRKCFYRIPCDPLPASGGIINEEVTILLPQGAVPHGVSYKGDIEGWRRSIVEWCTEAGLLWGKIAGDNIVLSNGKSYPLRDCQIDIR